MTKETARRARLARTPSDAAARGPSDVLGRDEAIRLVREALNEHQPRDNDGRAVHAVLTLDYAMRGGWR